MKGTLTVTQWLPPVQQKFIVFFGLMIWLWKPGHFLMPCFLTIS
jgi:hypothetical protein